MHWKRLVSKITLWSRKIHRIISPLIAAQLILSVTTGFLFMFFEKILSQKPPPILMEIHQGHIVASWTQIPFTIIYFTIIILGVLTGIPLMRKIWTRDFWRINSMRALHSFSATFMFLIYVNFAFTGMIYRNLREMFGVEKTYVKWLITFHAAGYNKWTMIIYISVVTVLTVLFVITGLVNFIFYLIQTFRQCRKKNVEVVDEEYANLDHGGEVDLNETMEALDQPDMGDYIVNETEMDLKDVEIKVETDHTDAEVETK